jgi:tetratricopeptide (TPR) repeat protein
MLVEPLFSLVDMLCVQLLESNRRSDDSQEVAVPKLSANDPSLTQIMELLNHAHDCSCNSYESDIKLNGYNDNNDNIGNKSAVSQQSVDALLRIASICEQLHQHKTALEYYQKATHRVNNLYGVNSPQFANTLLSQAQLFEKLGQVKDAFTLYSKSQKIHQQASGPKSKGVEQSMRGCVRMHMQMGEDKLALQACLQWLSLFSNVLSQNDSRVLDMKKIEVKLKQQFGDVDAYFDNFKH